MVQYRDLNAPPARTLAEIVADMRASERQSKTGDAGVKDLGETGDIIWPRWDGGEESVREVGENVEAARVSIAELNEVVLPELADELETSRIDLQQKLDAANARIDDIIVDGGGAGNFTTYSINEPTTAGTGEGDQWFRVVNGEVIGQWRWDGAAWQIVTLTDAIIAGIDLSKLVSNGNLSEVVANKIWADLFTANKITTDELAAGAVTAENLAAGAIRAESIEGGSFVGETFEGGTFTGGLFKTSDALPGQVEFADDGYIPSWGGVGEAYPGLRITPTDTSTTATPPGIGALDDGVIVDGGKSTSGVSSFIMTAPGAALLRSKRADGTDGGTISTTNNETLMGTTRVGGGKGGIIQTSPTASLMRTYREDGTVGGDIAADSTFTQMVTRAGENARGVLYADSTSAYIRTVDASNVTTARLHADATESYIYSRAGGTQRYLTVDATGVWVKTNKSGSWEWYNLEETANDSGWINFNAHSGISTGNSPAIRLKGGIVWAQGYVTRPAGWPSRTWTRVAGSFAQYLRPTRDILRTGATTADERLVVRMTATGYLEVWWSAAAPGNYQVDLSVLSYPNT